MFGGFALYQYGRKLIRHTKRYVKKTGTIRGSGIGTGLLYGLFSYFV